MTQRLGNRVAYLRLNLKNMRIFKFFQGNIIIMSEISIFEKSISKKINLVSMLSQYRGNILNSLK
ncbi:hypothetical protein BpHYR1_024610 [Brachionus plicatilis]|uniref:Uncharacterized protein n=1 Tax=Brachionus plicatilis TaxID=10195 RepID=A0A3M7SRJ8_BRAPC|nr:hypothetical protein BpHYR1_024610 [Brachionus plicatilis]